MCMYVHMYVVDICVHKHMHIPIHSSCYTHVSLIYTLAYVHMYACICTHIHVTDTHMCTCTLAQYMRVHTHG